jgi:His/Glu/Gln/Arg/opine family amino acid ABC transporter permease subunit
MDTFSLDLIYKSLPLLVKGAALSLEILFYAAIISGCFGGLFGILCCNQLSSRITAYIEAVSFALRAIPFYVQLLIVYFILPDLLGVSLEGFTLAVIALGVCSSGYVSQIVRCGINSIAQDQWEAAKTLGYSTLCTLYHIIIPQMMRNILPALTNELDSLLKSTSILSSIGLLELTRMGMNIVSREMAPLTIYLLLALFYVAISGVINLSSRYLEKRLQLCSQ